MSNLYERIKQTIQKLKPAPEAPEPIGTPAPEQVTVPLGVQPEQAIEKAGFLQHAQMVSVIRNSAQRKTLVSIRYHDRWRYVEPYSLRPGKQGVLFYGHDMTANDTHSYYIHKIQEVSLTDIPFSPRWMVEI
jgi:hypothetical protein